MNNETSAAPITNSPENANRQEMKALVANVLETCKLSRKQLAEKMEVTVSTVGNWVNGKSAGSKAQRETLRGLLQTPAV